MRLIGLGHDLSIEIADFIGNAGEMDRRTYDRIIDEAYRRFTTEQMARYKDVDN